MRAFALLFALLATPMSAHELWIEPTAFQVPADTRLKAKLVNGEDFKGVSLSYLPRNFSRFIMVQGGSFANVEGRIGDTPALDMDPVSEGLHVVAYISNPSTLTYETWEKFQAFVDHKDLGDARAEHTARALPETDFKELYIRYSKSLVASGNGEGDDRRLGMETEIVALTNPYVGDPTDTMRLQLFYQQGPRANEQIEVFEKAEDGTVEITLYRTDADGIADIAVKPGHIYMADAVVLREPSEQRAGSTGAVWETLWANLTWAMP